MRYNVNTENGDRGDVHYENVIENPAFPKESTKRKKLKFQASNGRFSTGQAIDPLSHFKQQDDIGGNVGARDGDDEEEEEYQIVLHPNPAYMSTEVNGRQLSTGSLNTNHYEIVSPCV